MISTFLLMSALLFQSSGAHTGAIASTHPIWYVRPVDGGTITQCNGRYDLPYPGSGTGQNCAVNSVKWLTTSTGWLPGAGDTVKISQAGTDYIGNQLAAGQPGSNWSSIDSSGCPAGGGWAPNCVLPQLPDNLRLLGYGAGNCHTSNWMNLQNASIWKGVGGVFWMLNLQNTNGVDVECIDMSSVDTCTHVAGTGQCVNGTQNYADKGINLEYLTGQGPRNATLKDISIHAMASQGILGGHLNTLSTDTFSASMIKLQGNGLSGWDSDGGSCGTSCENVGSATIDHALVDFSGCTEVEPNGGYDAFTGLPVNGFKNCATQQNTGYGDGFTLIASNTFALAILNSTFRWNMQDGVDALHLADDLTHPNINLTLGNNWSEGNAGQAYKMGPSSGGLAYAYNNVAIANCRIVNSPTTWPMTLNPSGYNSLISTADLCRAGGDHWAFQTTNGATISLVHNTSVGYGATMYDFECAFSGTCTTGTVGIFKDNISVGYPDAGNGGQVAGGLYFGTSPGPISDIFANAGSAIDHNLWYNMKSGTCPQDASETNSVCTDPVLTNNSIDSINPIPLSTSNARNTGVAYSGLTLDRVGHTLSSPPDIGAYAIVIGTTPSTTTVSSSATSPAYGTSVTFTISVSPSAATSLVNLKDGTTSIGTCTLSAGSCTYTTSTLAPGAHSISAYYYGDTVYAPSTSSTITVTVTSTAPLFVAASTLTNGSGSSTVSMTASCSAGHTLFLIAKGTKATDSLSATTLGSFTPTVLYAYQSFAGTYNTVGLKVWQINCSSGVSGSISVTDNFSSSPDNFITIQTLEYSGVTTGLDVQNTCSGQGYTTPSCGVTPSASNDTILALVINDQGPTGSATGFTNRFSHTEISEYDEIGTAGLQTFPAIVANGNAANLIAVFGLR